MLHLLKAVNVAFVLNTSMADFVEDESMDQARKRCRWKITDHVCEGLILNGMSDELFDENLYFGSARLL